MENENMFVVVNMSDHKPFGNLNKPGEHYLILGEDGITYASLEDAADVIVTAMIEYHHDLNTARLYKLVPVPLEEYQNIVKERYDDETAEDHEDLLSETTHKKPLAVCEAEHKMTKEQKKQPNEIVIDIEEDDGVFWVTVNKYRLLGSSDIERAKRDKIRCESGDLRHSLEEAMKEGKYKPL